jgi:Bax protein
MNKLLNFVCFPLLLVGLIFLSSGLVGYGTSYNKYIENNTHTANQINSLYSEKEIILKDPPVSEVLSEKLFVKIRVKPINPKITSKIKNLNELNNQSSLLNKDFDYLDSNKKDFVKTVLPIIINENQNILMTRSFVENLKNKLETFRTLENKEIRTLNDIAKNYNIKYREKHKLDLVNEILSNVDVIPNSIVLAQAAIESGWGSSRFAKEHNALFGEYTYDTEKGVIPLNRDSGKTHLIKSFNSLDSSVNSYFNNINSHYAYREFRNIRKIMRDKNNFSDVNLLVEKLETYAADSNDVNTIRSVIEKNNFKLFDNKTISY